ncbi:MAG: hypothetical protein IKU48_03625 [Clostridia bacterium]|nr:hypothetical protein [Clostridia bacterium]
MSNKKNRKKTISALFARSKIIEFFVAIASFLYSKAECSIVGKILTSYNTSSDEDSFICRLFKRFDFGKIFFRPLKRNVSKLVSRSILLEKANGYLKGWLFTKLNVYGLFSITTGVGFVLLQLLKAYGLQSGMLSFLDMFISLLMIIISIPLIISHSTLNEAVCESRVLKWMLFDWLGCKKETFEQYSYTNGHNRTALPLGLILCTFSWWVRPITLFALMGVFILAITVFYIPETGIVTLVLALPFLSDHYLKVMLIYITVCFLLKYIRGKRTVKFDLLAVAVLAYCVLVFLNSEKLTQGIFSVCVFFLLINLIKSRQWINRTLISFSFSFGLSVIYGIVAYIAARFEIGYLTYIFDCADIVGMESVFGSTAVFASYIVTVLPVIIVKRKGGKGAAAFFGTILGCVCLFLTGEYRAWFCMLFAVVFYLIFSGKRGLAFIGVLLCALPFVFINMPKGFIAKVFGDDVTGTIHGALFKEIHEHIDVFYICVVVLFTAVMFLCLQKNITLYSRGCSADGRKVSLAAMSGMVAFLGLGQGVMTGIDFRLSLIFWIILGLASCVENTERSNALYNETEEMESGKGELF